MKTIIQKPSKEQIAAMLRCTPEQAGAQLIRNAESMRRYTDKDLRRMRKTRAEMNAIADDYEARGRA